MDEKILGLALIGIILMYYTWWYVSGGRKARKARSGLDKLSDAEFVACSSMCARGVPESYVISFRRFFESAYGVEETFILRPDMTLDDIAAISGDAPMVDAIEVSWLSNRMEAVSMEASAVLKSGTVGEIILRSWEMGIDAPATTPRKRKLRSTT